MKTIDIWCDNCRNNITNHEHYIKDADFKRPKHLCISCMDIVVLKRLGWIKQW